MGPMIYHIPITTKMTTFVQSNMHQDSLNGSMRWPFGVSLISIPGMEFVPEYHGVTVTVAKGSQGSENDRQHVKELSTARRISAIKQHVILKDSHQRQPSPHYPIGVTFHARSVPPSIYPGHSMSCSALQKGCSSSPHCGAGIAPKLYYTDHRAGLCCACHRDSTTIPVHRMERGSLIGPVA